MPLASTAQSHMPLDGHAPNVDSNGFLYDVMMKLRVVAKTAAYTVLATESGTLFTTVGATTAIVFTLPAVATGLVYFFYNAEDIDMTVNAAAANTMVAFNDTATADGVAFSTTSEKIGNGLMCVSDGTNWLAFAMLGQDSATITVTSS